MSIDNQVDNAPEVNSISYDELLASGDPDLVQIAREQMGLTDGQALESAVKDDATQSVSTPQEAPAPAATEQEALESDKPKNDFVHGVYDKAGKNILPYEELASSRRKSADLQAQLEASTEEAAKLRRQMELAKTRGVALPTLPEDEKITDDMLQEMEDISPEFGVLARKLKFMEEKVSRENDMLASARSPAHAPTDNTDPAPQFERQAIQAAMQANPAITAVMKDPKLAKLAISIEQMIDGDPQYESLEARYHEVVRRLGGATGTDYFAMHGMASSSPKANLPRTPHSMSDLASSAPLAGRSDREVLADLSTSDLQTRMDSMTTAQLEALMG